MFAAAVTSRVQRWWRKASGQHFYERRAADPHTAHPTWRIGTAIGSQREERGQRADSGSPLAPRPAAAEPPPPGPAPR